MVTGSASMCILILLSYQSEELADLYLDMAFQAENTAVTETGW